MKTTTRDYAAEYKTASKAARQAETFTERGKLSNKAGRILSAADRAGVYLHIGDIENEINRELGII